MLDWYKYEDGDQGYDGSFAMYMNDHYKGGYDQWWKDGNAARVNYKNECRKAVNEFLGENANTPVKDVIGPSRKQNPNLVIEDLLEWAQIHESIWGKID